jgi:alpha-L-fucosidase
MDDTPYTPEKGNSGIRGGPIWNPAETDVSIRPGWFWHADEDDKVRSPANLLNLYLDSVGRGSNLLLNVPPDRTGRIGDSDARNLAAFRAILDTTYADNLAARARVTASSTFSPACAPAKVLSGKGFWAAREDDRAGAWLQLTFPNPVRFDLIRLREALPFGVRVDDYAIDVRHDGEWQTIARHTCIGPQRLVRLDAPVTAREVRLRVTRAAASPVISEFSLYRLPDIVEEPAIARDRDGLVTIKAAGGGQRLVYTLDGSAPGTASTRYGAPFALPDGGTVRAVAIAASGTASAVSTADFDVAPGRWTVTTGGKTAPGLLDGSGVIGAPGEPLDIVIDLAQSYDLKGFTLAPLTHFKLDLATAERIGPPAGYTAWVGDDGKTWGNPAASGEFANIAASRSVQKVGFTTPHRGRYLRLLLPRAVQDKPMIAAGSVGILTR